MRLSVQGGPADGACVAEHPGPFRWIDGVREQGFACSAPGRALYRRRAGAWVFAGVECWQCACGSVVAARVPACPLCGRSREAVGDG